MNPILMIELGFVPVALIILIAVLTARSENEIRTRERVKENTKKRLALMDRWEAAVRKGDVEGMLNVFVDPDTPAKPGPTRLNAKEAPAAQLEGGNDSPPAGFLGLLVPAVLLGGLLLLIASTIGNMLRV